MSAGRWDPITLEIMWRRLISIADQAGVDDPAHVVFDRRRVVARFRYVLTDARGQSLAQSYLGEVMFVTTFPDCVKNILAEIGADQMRPGDVFITNDPWLAAGHLPDIHVATPVFHRGELVAFSGSVIHVSDIGGRFGPHDATEVYEEGICLPVLRLLDQGALNTDLPSILRANVRVWDLVHGDVMAQVAGNAVGARLLCDFLDEYAIEDLGALSTTIQARVESAMRAKIGRSPTASTPSRPSPSSARRRGHGDQHADHHRRRLDAGRLRRLVAADDVRGRQLRPQLHPLTHPVPDSGASPARGPANEGATRPIEIVAPPGSVMNALRPAPVDIRAIVTSPPTRPHPGPTRTARARPGDRSERHPLDALADRRTGQTQKRTIASFFQAGLGAAAQRDGPNAKFFPIKAYHTSVERFEREIQLLVEEKAPRPDSGGPGRRRGGLGQRITLRNQSPDPVNFTFYRRLMRRPASGYLGGEPGSLGRITVDNEPLATAVMTLAPGSRAVLEDFRRRRIRAGGRPRARACARGRATGIRHTGCRGCRLRCEGRVAVAAREDVVIMAEVPSASAVLTSWHGRGGVCSSSSQPDTGRRQLVRQLGARADERLQPGSSSRRHRAGTALDARGQRSVPSATSPAARVRTLAVAVPGGFCNRASWERSSIIARDLVRGKPGDLRRARTGGRLRLPEVGVLALYRSQDTLDRGLADAKTLAGLGIFSESLDRAAVADRVPGLQAAVVGGIDFPEDASLATRGRLVRSVASLAERLGARVRPESASCASRRPAEASRRSRPRRARSSRSWSSSPLVPGRRSSSRGSTCSSKIEPGKGYSLTFPGEGFGPAPSGWPRPGPSSRRWAGTFAPRRSSTSSGSTSLSTSPTLEGSPATCGST